MLNIRKATLCVLYYLLGEALPLPVPLTAREITSPLTPVYAASPLFYRYFIVMLII